MARKFKKFFIDFLKWIALTLGIIAIVLLIWAILLSLEVV